MSKKGVGLQVAPRPVLDRSRRGNAFSCIDHYPSSYRCRDIGVWSFEILSFRIPAILQGWLLLGDGSSHRGVLYLDSIAQDLSYILGIRLPYTISYRCRATWGQSGEPLKFDFVKIFDFSIFAYFYVIRRKNHFLKFFEILRFLKLVSSALLAVSRWWIIWPRSLITRCNRAGPEDHFGYRSSIYHLLPL